MAKGQQKKNKEAKKPKKRLAFTLNRLSDEEGRMKDIADLLMFWVWRIIGRTGSVLK
ncbi:MAG: hypothetical protein ABI865_14525 [Nitrosospira sp.]